MAASKQDDTSEQGGNSDETSNHSHDNNSGEEQQGHSDYALDEDSHYNMRTSMKTNTGNQEPINFSGTRSIAQVHLDLQQQQADMQKTQQEW